MGRSGSGFVQGQDPLASCPGVPHTAPRGAKVHDAFPSFPKVTAGPALQYGEMISNATRILVLVLYKTDKMDKFQAHRKHLRRSSVSTVAPSLVFLQSHLFAFCSQRLITPEGD